MGSITTPRTSRRLLVIGFAVLAACTCAEEPKPIRTVAEFAREATGDWLDVRLDHSSWAELSSQQAGWRTVTTVTALAAWFPAKFDPDSRWDYADNVVVAIRASEVFANDPQTDAQLLETLQAELTAYRWNPDRGDSLQSAVAGRVTPWLDARLEDDDEDVAWNKFQSPQAAWRDPQATPSLDAMSQWFVAQIGAAWDLTPLVTEIQSTDAVRKYALKPGELRERLRRAFDEYQRQN